MLVHHSFTLVDRTGTPYSTYPFWKAELRQVGFRAHLESSLETHRVTPSCPPWCNGLLAVACHALDGP